MVYGELFNPIDKRMLIVFSTLVKKINSFVNRPFFLQAQTLLERIPGRPLRIAKIFILEFNDTPVIQTRNFGIIRQAVPEDVTGMCLLQNKEEIFSKRFAFADHCIVAEEDGRIVGYEWFSTKPVRIEDRYSCRIQIPNDGVYIFDAFIKPEYRLRGIWLLFKIFILAEGSCSGRRKLITLVDYGNTPSLKAHLRFGFVITRQLICFMMLNKAFYMEKQIDQEKFDVRKVLK